MKMPNGRSSFQIEDEDFKTKKKTVELLSLPRPSAPTRFCLHTGKSSNHGVAQFTVVPG